MSAGIRVLVVGSYAYPDSFEWHVTDSLRTLGCEVRLFHDRVAPSGLAGAVGRAAQRAKRLLLLEPERLAEPRLLRAVNEFGPTLVLVLLGNQVSPKTVAALRTKTKAPIVCWCQDQMTTLGRQFLLGSGYDAVFVKDRYLQDLFSRLIYSTTFYYLPEACNPRMHRPLTLSQTDLDVYSCDVMIAGTLYYYRQEVLRELKDFDLKIWGSRPEWLMDRLPGRFMGRYVHGDAKVRAALGAKICLNTLHYAEVDGLNCRAFELAGCGGFQLINRVPVLKEHFEPEVEIATYATLNELKEKVDYYVRNPTEAGAIAERGRQRAHREHTYEHRLREILRISLS
jgi:spore maturation protein CgeB